MKIFFYFLKNITNLIKKKRVLWTYFKVTVVGFVFYLIAVILFKPSN